MNTQKGSFREPFGSPDFCPHPPLAKLKGLPPAIHRQQALSVAWTIFALNFCLTFLGSLQFLSSLIKIIPYFYCICFSFTLSRIELTFCHSDHKVILRWGCFRRSTVLPNAVASLQIPLVICLLHFHTEGIQPLLRSKRHKYRPWIKEENKAISIIFDFIYLLA